MKITTEVTPKEIADLVVELQSRQGTVDKTPSSYFSRQMELLAELSEHQAKIKSAQGLSELTKAMVILASKDCQ